MIITLAFNDVRLDKFFTSRDPFDVDQDDPIDLEPRFILAGPGIK